MLQLISKTDPFTRINLSRTHSRLAPLCFDKSLGRLSVPGTIILNKINHHLLGESRNDEKKNQCLCDNILEELRMKNFNKQRVPFYY